jgi:hypothetical protein
MAAKSEKRASIAQVAAGSPCRGGGPAMRGGVQARLVPRGETLRASCMKVVPFRWRARLAENLRTLKNIFNILSIDGNEKYKMIYNHGFVCL